jgi:hypothetical protein
VSNRNRLKNRRPNETHTIEVALSDPHVTTEIVVTLGFDMDTNKIQEIFISQGKTGSDMDAILSDAAILVSRCLQAGMSLAELGESIGRLGDDFEGGTAMRPSTFIGAAIDLAHFVEGV